MGGEAKLKEKSYIWVLLKCRHSSPRHASFTTPANRGGAPWLSKPETLEMCVVNVEGCGKVRIQMGPFAAGMQIPGAFRRSARPD